MLIINLQNQVFVTNEFDASKDFQTTYEEILDIPGLPKANDVTYTLEKIHSGGFVIFERQELGVQSRLDVVELEVVAKLEL